MGSILSAALTNGLLGMEPSHDVCKTAVAHAHRGDNLLHFLNKFISSQSVLNEVTSRGQVRCKYTQHCRPPPIVGHTVIRRLCAWFEDIDQKLFRVPMVQSQEDT